MDNKKEYALYKGENLLSIGTIEEIAQEVSVQEQYVGKCNHCGYINEFSLPIGIHIPSGINPKFCMRCSRPTTYNVKKEE